MSGINFLHKDDADKKRAEKVRAMVVPITTAIMVVYLVSASALFGWWWWWSSKQVKVSTELTTLLGQVNSKQQAEVLAKRMIDRVKVINAYISSRKDIYGNTEFLVDKAFTVTNFGLTKGGYYFVEVESAEPSEVTSLEGELKLRYEDVVVNRFSWENQLWKAVYWYRGNKS